MEKSLPHAKPSLLSFSNLITVYGDGTKPSGTNIGGDQLYDMQKLFDIVFILLFHND
jgi:hypothetical protein